MKILVIAPHMDDEVLGMGGTIAKHVADGDEVYVCYIAHRVYEHRYDEEKNQVEVQCALKAKEILGYKEAKFLNLNDERLDACIQDVLIPLEAYLNEINPEAVYINHGGDNHQDHKAVFQAGMVALRPSANPDIKRVLCYEIPS
jgi:LmbE family N-acetylglucosaminyl deacetylase